MICCVEYVDFKCEGETGVTRMTVITDKYNTIIWVFENMVTV